ncbi:hypothetical protein AB1Y20_016281 [Prymnesium parvum]|uniref:Clathrin light chain n=1 Tax=Prymnesium parvum TaxID=97485 RepID=A0AB34IFH8_PRYPA
MFSDMPSATSATPAAADFGDFGGFGGFGGEGESSAAEGSAPSSAGGAATSPLPSAPMTAAEAPPMEHAAPDGGVEAFGDFEDVEEPAANGGEEAPPAEAVGVDDFDDFGTPADDGAADGFAAFAAAPEASGAGAEAGGAASKAPPHADDSASGASTLSALEKRLSEAKVERERANIEMAADSFLTSLDAPLHRTRSFDSTPSEVDDLEFQNLTPVGSDADKLRALDAGGVTDDEFNALFGAD